MSTDKQTKDDFWDLEKLLPKKKKPLSPFATRSPMAEYTDTSETPAPSDRGACMLTSLPETVGRCKQGDESYTPAHQKLLRRVTVRRYEGRYMFYDSFRRAAELYYDVRGTVSPFAPFYSYMPQYQQMSREQKDYYFYWRDEVRAGRYIKTDVSYVYLYAYEIINLPEKQSAEEGLRQLLLLWKIYRKELRGIDKYFSVWIQDFCLLYRLTPPAELVRDCLAELISVSAFKEFYLIDSDAMTAEGLSSLLFYFSDYDYHTSRYYTAQSKDVFEMHMCASVGPILARVLANTDTAHAPTSLLVRDAFPNSLCTHEVKCRLEIEYLPLSRAVELRSAITAAVKYTENRLRACLGVKSRLAVRGLCAEDKAHIDRYFEDIFMATRREREQQAVPAYEEKYDMPHETLSFAGADDIERLSWDNTVRLVSEEEAALLRGAQAAPVPEEHRAPSTTPAQAMPVDDTDTYGLPTESLAFLRSVLNGAPTACGMEADALAESVNEAFAEGFGDIVLELRGDTYCVMEDYREDVEAWLSSKGM